MIYGICHLTCIPVRGQPDIHSEMTNQLLFGDAFEAVETERNFWRIRLGYDEDEGWIDQRQVVEISEREFLAIREQPFPITTELVSQAANSADGCWLLRGSSLPNWNPEACTLGFAGRTFTFEGATSSLQGALPSNERFLDYLAKYLDAPYLWGGRSPFGIDCSGFVQIGFKAIGIRLGRNTIDQIKNGKPVEGFAYRRSGDLAFFGSGADGSRHVGIVLPGGIIHASGKVRIDPFSEEGIRHAQTGELTHQLTQIRRVGSSELFASFPS